MSTDTLKVWIRAIRPFAYSGSLIPVVIGTIAAIGQADFNWPGFLLVFFGILILHTGANLISDYNDYINGIDTKESFGSSGVLVEKLIAPKKIKTAAKCLLLISALIAISLALLRGWPVIVFALTGILGGYFYTGKPLRLKYRGLGDPVIFILFGPLLVGGAYYIQTQAVLPAPFILSIPVGLMTTAILHANDIRDLVHDKAAGIKSFSMIIGEGFAKHVYVFLIAGAYLSVPLFVMTGILGYWSLACFVTLPLALRNIRSVKNAPGSREIIMLDKDTAKLAGQFGIVLILTILIDILI